MFSSLRSRRYGDNAAFDTLLRRHQNRVFTYILNIVKNKDVADDVFQETFVKAIMTIRQGRHECPDWDKLRLKWLPASAGCPADA